MTLLELPPDLLQKILLLATLQNPQFYFLRCVSKLFYKCSKDPCDRLMVDRVVNSYEAFRGKYEDPSVKLELVNNFKLRAKVLDENNDFFTKMRNHIEILAGPDSKGNSHAQFVLFKSHCFFWYQQQINKSDDPNFKKIVFQKLIPRKDKNEAIGFKFLQLAAPKISEAEDLWEKYSNKPKV